LLLLLISISLIPLIGVSLLLLERAQEALSIQAFAQLQTIRDTKKTHIERYFAENRSDIILLSKTPHISVALDAFASILDQGVIDQDQYDYFESLEYGEGFQSFITEYGHHDLMLVSKKGDIVYSVRGEPDLTGNLLEKPLSKTLLGQAFKQGLEKMVSTDFSIYKPSENQLIAFLLAPISLQGETLGVVVLKTTPDAINRIMQERSGMVESSEAYLVGPDFLMRSDSYLSPKNRTVKASFATPSTGAVKTEASHRALAGESGQAILSDYLGVQVLSAYTPLHLTHGTYALIAETNEAEAFKPIYELQRMMWMVGLGILLLVLLTAMIIANRITKPITSLTNASLKIAEGDLEQEVVAESTDELGTLSDNFNRMRLSIRDKIQLIQEKSRELDQINEGLEKQVAQRTEALEETQARFELAVTGSGDALWEYDSQTGENWFSPRFVELLGYEMDELPPTLETWAVHIHPDDKKRAIDAFDRHLEDDTPYDIEYRMRTKSGEYLWFLARAKTLRDSDGKPLRTSGSISDITERHAMEESIKLNNLLSNIALELTDSAYWHVDYSDPDYYYQSERAAKMLGEPIKENSRYHLQDEWFSRLQEANPELADKTAERYQGAIDGKYLSYDSTYAYKRPIDGKIIWLHAAGKIIRDEDNKIQYMYGVYQDVTENMSMEIRLKDQIEKLADARRASLNMMLDLGEEQKLADKLRQTADEANQAKSDFLANMSHEIRTPMNAIIGMSHLALHTELTRKQRNYIEKVNRSGESLLGIINDILDFSKIEAGKLDMEAIDFHLEDVFDNLSSLVGLKAEEKSLELLFDVDPTVPTALVGDPLRLGQILVNLGNNAVKFTEKGEIVIRAKAEKQPDGRIKFHFFIQDSGIGLTPEQQSKLFQSFSQADASTTRKYGGTGLGLTISKRLTELMDGEIWVESEAGKGSVFQFTAYLTVQENPKERYTVNREAISGLRVLVVDDNTSAREILSTMAVTFGLEVDVAQNGADAIRQINDAVSKEIPYDLTLMDWKMPGMDGVECVRLLQEEKNIVPPAVIMVTAYGREEAIQAALVQGAQIKTVLTKPVTPSTLLDAIGETLGRGLVSHDKGSLGRSKSADEAASKLRGAKILLVEDNDINQELALELLANGGINADLATNGQEALDKLAINSYDGVLMDLQMPIMDGYKATYEIRKQECFKDLPVIAMTANAMAGDKEKVLEAGMNDHIAKPINVRDMFTTMAKWITPSQPADEIKPTPSTTSAQETEPLPDLPGIDTKAGLATTQNNMKLYRRLLTKFGAGQSQFEDEIKSALDQEDLETATRIAHTLKGVAGNLGAKSVQEAARFLEQACDERVDRGEIDTLLQDTLHELNPVLEGLTALNTKQHNQSTPTKSLINLDQIKLVIEKIREKLKDDDSEAVDDIEELEPLLAGTAFEASVRMVGKQINGYDFDAALETLEKMDTALESENR
jgi:PAS domain S-box-containing protein